MQRLPIHDTCINRAASKETKDVRVQLSNYPGWTFYPETLKSTQNVAEKCYDTTVVHHDLAIARLTLQIQATEYPGYDNVLKQFHILRWIRRGRYTTETDVLTDVLASLLYIGSLNCIRLAKLSLI